MAEQWSKHVNTRFYGQDGGYAENTEKVEFKSGRTVEYLKNSVPRKTHAVSLCLSDMAAEKTDGRTEFGHFLDWYENVIMSGTVPFYLTDIATGSGERLYRLTEPPSWTGQGYKEVSLTLEEA